MSIHPAGPDPAAEAVLAGRYELFEPIGSGGMSTVYRGRDRALGRPVAIKVIRHDPAEHDREHLRDRFRREAANAARVPPHPNVVQIYDYGTDPGGDRDFIVMELLGGRDLKAVLRDGPPDTAAAVRILLQAARGLAAGHRAGIVHRDVKPANILLPEGDADGPVKIVDFGIAKALESEPDDDLTRAGGVPHTPSYASPEQLAGARTLSPASDVYQLGLVAYELLAGERPFDAYDRERLRRGEPLPVPSGGRWNHLPAPLRDVVERALRTDPAARFPDAGAFAEALARAGEDDGTLLAPSATENATATAAPGIDIRPAQPSRTGPAVSLGDRWRALPAQARAAVMIVAAVLLLWLLLRGGGEDAPAPAPAAADNAELEETFAPLYREGAERLAEEGE